MRPPAKIWQNILRIQGTIFLLLHNLIYLGLLDFSAKNSFLLEKKLDFQRLHILGLLQLRQKNDADAENLQPKRPKKYLKNVFALGSGCSTAVEHTPRNLEVVGSIYAGCWAFFSSFSSFNFFYPSLPTFLHKWNVLYQVSQGSASLTVCCERIENLMPSWAAWVETG